MTSPDRPAVRWSLCLMIAAAAACLPSAPAAFARDDAATAPARSPWGKYAHASSSSVLGSTDPDSGFLFGLELDSRGAAVATLKLSGVYATVADKQLAEELDSESAYQKRIVEDPETYQGHYSLLNPVGIEGRRSLPFATNQLVVSVDGGPAETFTVGERNWQIVEAPDDGDANTRSARFAWTLLLDAAPDAPDGDYRPLLTIHKTYTVRKGDYSFELDVEVVNHSEHALSVAIDQFGPTGVPREDLRTDRRQAPYGRRVGKNDVEVSLKLDHKTALEMPPGRSEASQIGTSIAEDPVVWVGQTNQFFASLMYLKPPAGGPEGNESASIAAWQARFFAFPRSESRTSRTFVTGTAVGARSRWIENGRVRYQPALAVAPGETVRVGWDVFCGPKKRDIFVDSANPYYRPLYAKLDYLSTIDLSGCFCTLSWLAMGMMRLLDGLSWVALGNYGVGIILLVVLVRTLLYPLSKRGQVSMLKMQELAPEIKKLQEKYADDKQAQQREMAKFYKENGFGAFFGCLPMLLQMPVWIALWTALNASVNLRHAAFLPVWITNLAGPDALISWSNPVYVPLLSSFMGPFTSFNLLPLLLCVAFFLQMKLNPQMSGGPAVAASPEQQAQKKMMQFMMPGMMLLFFYQAPSGLTLYIMTSTFVGVAEQRFIRRHIQKKRHLAEQTETRVSAPGKPARSARPKKPKGPNWVKGGK